MIDRDGMKLAWVRTTYWDGGTIQEAAEEHNISCEKVRNKVRDHLRWADGETFELSVGGWMRIQD